nr:hypothetical protein [Proteiniphilum sp.]
MLLEKIVKTGVTKQKEQLASVLIPVKNPKKRTAETPNLYSVGIELIGSNQVLQAISRKYRISKSRNKRRISFSQRKSRKDKRCKLS